MMISQWIESINKYSFDLFVNLGKNNIENGINSKKYIEYEKAICILFLEITKLDEHLWNNIVDKSYYSKNSS